LPLADEADKTSAELRIGNLLFLLIARLKLHFLTFFIDFLYFLSYNLFNQNIKL
jgi:hypothetical protein